AKAGAAVPAVTADRRQAGARQDRWMLEMEKAFAAETERPNQAATHASPTARADGARPAAPASAALLMQHGPSAPRAALAEASGSRGRVGLHGDAQAPASPVRRPGPAQEAPSSREHRGVKDAAHAHAQASAQAVAQAVAQIQHAAMPGDAGALSAASVDAVAATSLTAPGAALVRPAALNPALGGDGQVAALAGAAGRSLRLSFSAAAGGQLAPVAARFAGVEEPPVPAGAARKDADGKPFDKRAMHVYVDNQGVHAFIRDAALQAGQLRGMVQALSTELAASGKSLAALTVNGKPVDARGATAQADDDDTYTQHEARGQHGAALNYSTQPAFKGHP
ncbi:MAG: hypothetical protein WKG03_19345, partial [Telluria sp.]